MRGNKFAIKKCKFCGKNFKLNVYRYGLKWLKKHNRGIYCSKKCYFNSRKTIRCSPKTEFKKGYNWDKCINFKTGKWSYRQFKKEKCELCGKNYFLHVHHLDKNRDNNNLDNLITVCAKCHKQFHPVLFWHGNQYVKTK